jgi:hypothetical protein
MEEEKGEEEYDGDDDDYYYEHHVSLGKLSCTSTTLLWSTTALKCQLKCLRTKSVICYLRDK